MEIGGLFIFGQFSIAAPITKGTGIIHLVTMLNVNDPDGKTAGAAGVARYNKVLPSTRATSFDGTGFVFLPTICTETNGQKHVIGTASNNALTPDIRLLSPEAFKNFLAISPKRLVPSNSPCALVDSAITQLTEPLYLARCSSTIAIPDGTPAIVKGRADDQAVEDGIAEFGGPSGANWHYHNAHWNPDVQAAFLTEPDLAKYLPPGGGDVAKYYSNPHFNYELVHLDDDDELRLADERKRHTLQGLITLSQQRKTPESRDTPPVAEVAILSPLQRAPPLAAQRKSEKFEPVRKNVEARDALLGARWKDFKLKDEVLPPVFTTLSTLIHECSSKAEMTTVCSSGLRTNAKKLSESRDFALRHVSLPSYEPVMDAYQAITQVHPHNLDSLTDCKTSGITYSSFFSDTAQSIALKNKDKSQAVAEDAVTGFQTVLSCNTNSLNYFTAKYVFDYNSKSYTLDWPNYAAYLREVSDLLTGEESKIWLKKFQGTSNEIQLAYYIISGMNSILARLGGVLDDQECLMNAIPARFHLVSVRGFYAAERSFTTLKETIENCLCEAIEPPTSPLWNSSEAKRVKEQRELMIHNQKWNIGRGATPAHSPAPVKSDRKSKAAHEPHAGKAAGQPKRKTHHSNLECLGPDGKVGYIICPDPTANGLKFPTDLDAERPGTGFSICKNYYRHGSKCNFGSTCNRIHTHPKDLPLDKGKSLSGPLWRPTLPTSNGTRKWSASANLLLSLATSDSCRGMTIVYIAPAVDLSSHLLIAAQ
eukprot:scaffold11779_cov39-Cyclotella_meneghiniana.AAC.3